MPGIILSLLVTLIALSFAFYTDDSSNARGRRNWRDSSAQVSRRSPEAGTRTLVKTDKPESTDDPGSATT